jgi:hypothetical protein
MTEPPDGSVLVKLIPAGFDKPPPLVVPSVIDP